MDGDGKVVLPAGVLQQDACIIDEQAEHLVLTLRVPKAKILSNHLLLMALSEVVSERDCHNAPPVAAAMPPPPVKSKRRPHLGYAAALVVAIMAPSPIPIFQSVMASHAPPPVEYGDWKIAKPVFKVGDPIDIALEYRRGRDCMTSYDRTIVRASDNSVAFSDRVFGGSAGTTDQVFQPFHLVLHLAQPLPPGKYIYTGNTHSDCAHGGAYDAPHGKLAFSVE